MGANFNECEAAGLDFKAAPVGPEIALPLMDEEQRVAIAVAGNAVHRGRGGNSADHAQAARLQLELVRHLVAREDRPA